MSGFDSTNKSSSRRTIYALLISVVVILAVCLGYSIYYFNGKIGNLEDDIVSQKKQYSSEYTSGKSIKINIFSPLKNSIIASPLTVIGQTPGSWSFEGTFPIRIINSSGETISSGVGSLIGEWMTTDLVPFTSTLSWSEGQVGTGYLIIQKDNPSGLAENDDSISIPIRFN